MKNGIIILAAGDGRGMKSKKPKVMSEILFKPMIDWVISAVKEAETEDICVITGAEYDYLADYLGETVSLVCPSLAQSTEFIKEHEGGNILILGGDTPFMDSDTIRGTLALHADENNDVTLISEDAVGYCFRADILYSVLEKLREEKEYSLGDVVTAVTDEKGSQGVYKPANPMVSLTAQTKSQLYRLNDFARNEILEKLMDSGVDIPCKDGIIIGPGCKIGCDTTILPNTVIHGDVTIGEDCVIGPNSYVYNAEIGNGVSFNNGQIRNAKIMNDANIGPFVQIRPDAVIKDGVHLGNFVEVKNSTIGENTSVSHLTYVGDSDVGSGVNFGCGVVTVNFNGKTKNRTVIKDRAFIGCNTNLVAPVTVGENSYTAAGSTITEDVPDNTLAIARERQTNKEGWVKEKQPYRKKV